MDRASSPEPRVSTRLLVALILGAALLVAVAFGVGRMSVPADSAPSTTSAEAGFARDMMTHHHQAVEMSLLIRDRTDDEDVRLLAFDIATAQGHQEGQMFGWLEVWGLPQAESEPSMTWMSRPTLDGAGHDHGGDGDAAHTPGDPMPGLATSQQIAELTALEGEQAEVLFLELMIEHHRGGVDMANAILQRSDERVVTKLAKGMVVVQDKEIDLMQDMLEERRSS